MFMEKGHCPTCNTESQVIQKNPIIFRCAKCETIFSEFGFVKAGEEVEINFA